ncbi:MAG TPA: LCP family protein [Clostridia bacterium]|nr:LCP family protein [Clostridia bacterium]
MREKQKTKKKLRLAAKIALGLVALVLTLGIAVAVLGTNLLNRLTRTDPDDAYLPGATITPLSSDEAPNMTPTPTRSPAPSATQPAGGTPAASAQPTLPLSEYYNQTQLTVEQLKNFREDNLDLQYVNVLLIGADRRSKSGAYNSDTMMIATIDKVHNRLKLTSLMRDMLVEIPGYGYGKLNSAAARGGMQLLFDTIYHNFHIRITNYVLVDLYTFVEVIDAMGGVIIDMTAGEISSANDNIAGLNKQLGVEYLWDGFIFADPGPVLLTGKQALGYIRIRHLDSEFVRVERQYTLLSTVFAQFMKMSATKQYSVLYDMLPMVETNLTNAQIVDIAMSALSMKAKGILFYRLPVEGLYQNGKWEKRFVFFGDLPAMSLKLNEFIFDSDQKPKPVELHTPNPSLPARTPGGATVTPSPGGGVLEPSPTPDVSLTPSPGATQSPAPTLPPETEATPSATP